MQEESLMKLYQIFLKYRKICTDNRKAEKGSLFFALKGENFDANAFASSALENGCEYAVIDNPEYAKGEKYILVDNVLNALQQLSLYYRKQLKIPFIGITGTNGKTTSKELIAAVLSKKYRVHATQGNFNNHIGVPLTLLSIPDNAEIAVIEMGANHPGEIKELCQISLPDFGLITNIGKAHLEGFGNIEGVVNTKRALYDAINDKQGTVFVSRDNALLMNLSSEMKRITYGVFPDSNCRGEILDSNPMLMFQWYAAPGKILKIQSNLVGFYNFENLLAAVCIGDYFKVEPELIQQAIEGYIPSNNRSQVIKTEKNTVIMDAYNANPTSMDASIRSFAAISNAKKFAIVGDMLELGNESEIEHKRIFELIANAGFEHVFFVGKCFSAIKDEKGNYSFFNSSDLAADALKSMNPEGFTFLIKGSRGIKLEKVLECL